MADIDYAKEAREWREIEKSAAYCGRITHQQACRIAAAVYEERVNTLGDQSAYGQHLRSVLDRIIAAGREQARAEGLTDSQPGGESGGGARNTRLQPQVEPTTPSAAPLPDESQGGPRVGACGCEDCKAQAGVGLFGPQGTAAGGVGPSRKEVAPDTRFDGSEVPARRELSLPEQEQKALPDRTTARRIVNAVFSRRRQLDHTEEWFVNSERLAEDTRRAAEAHYNEVWAEAEDAVLALLSGQSSLSSPSAGLKEEPSA